MRSPFQKVREFVSENGWYLLVDEVAEQMARSIRSGLLSSSLHTKGLRIGPQSRIRGAAHIKVGAHFHAGRGLWLDAVTRYREQIFFPKIEIGNEVRMSHWVHIAATHRVQIGDHCLFGSRVLITDHAHGRYSKTYDSPQVPPAERNLDADRSVFIGRNVFLGDNVVVLPGVTIGEGAVIGANSVVTRDIPPITMAAGAPAIALKHFDAASNTWKPC